MPTPAPGPPAAADPNEKDEAMTLPEATAPLSDALLETLARLTTGADYWTTVSSEAFGVARIRLADGPHGLRVQDDNNPDLLGLGRSIPSTCFPTGATLAASWDAALVEEVGAALGREARSLGVHVVLGPGLNIKRSPLCGRNFEYYSEDPLLAGRLAGANVRGIQSNGVSACLKHFAANNQETDRMRISADVDERTLRELYLRAFQIAVREGQPWVIMSAYNRINAVSASEDPWLLTTVLRDEWGFDGVVVSDWGAVRDPVDAVRAGLDLRMPGLDDDPRVFEALRSGALEQSHAVLAVDRLRLLSERTGAGTDTRPAEMPPYEDHHALARRAAAESAILVHNDAGLLPIDAGQASSIAVIGELARTPRFQGAGSSAVNPFRVVSPLDALHDRLVASPTFEPGYRLDGHADPAMLDRAVALARSSDLVLLFLGLPAIAESEGFDRQTIDLPTVQLDLLRAVAAVNPRVVVSLSNGSVVTTASWRNEVGAIVEFWLAGQAAGDAVADVLTGAVNPSGKLPETVPVRLADTPAYLDFPGGLGHVRYSEGMFVGYRWYDVRAMEVDYPFGHGLSYTRFDYSDLTVETFDEDDPEALRIAFTLTNAGSRAGAEVAQLYVGRPASEVLHPVRELRGFQKVRLEAGASQRVELTVSREDLGYFHADCGWVFEGGVFDLAVGASSRDLRLKQSAEIAGPVIKSPLTLWSLFGDWMDHPQAAPMLWTLIDNRGGLRGRIGDLFQDEAGRETVRGIPLLTILQLPGIPFTEEEAAAIVADVSEIA
jgi:beta-glucosidase